MEHRGKQYSVVQGIDGRWKWSIDLDGHTKSGVTCSRQAAIKLAEKEIERAAMPKKRRLVPPGR